MKYFFLAAIFLLTFFSCKKNTEDQPIPPITPPTLIDFTQTPSPSLITTNITAYVIKGQVNEMLANPYLNYLPNPINGHALEVKNLQTDKYATTIYGYARINAFDYAYKKTFTAISNYKNYVTISAPEPAIVGYTNYNYGAGTFALPSNGSITVPPNSYNGDVGAATVFVYANYLSPEAKDFAVNSPCYPMADLAGGNRSYLNSYGIYQVLLLATNNLGNSIDFAPNSNVVLKMGIPQSQLATAPDSIPAFYLNTNNIWKQDGFGVKVNAVYEKKIGKKGYWNFAMPSNGVYVKIHLRSNDNSPVLNTRITVKNNSKEFADARTNAEGDALVFLPTKTDFLVDVTNDHFFQSNPNPKLLNLSLGNFNYTTETTITLPDKIGLVSLEGNVFNCDGTPLLEGKAIISGRYSDGFKDAYTYSIKNGNFKSATWTNGTIANIKLYNNIGSQIIDYQYVLSSYLNSNAYSTYYNSNFYTCANSSKLFCNYFVDSSLAKISGDINISNPTLTVSRINQSQNYLFNVEENGKGVSFGFVIYNYPAGPVINYGSDDRVKVNGNLYKLVPNPEISLTRKDVTINGFWEGMFNIYYLDSLNVKRNVRGNFRVKNI